MRDIDDISAAVLDASIQIHRDLGPGLFESVYETMLAGRLARAGYEVARQRSIDMEHDGLVFEAAFRIDLLIDNRLVVEIKAVDRLGAMHHRQVLTYLRILKQPVGLLINFNEALLKDGFHRIVNDYRPPSSASSSSASPRSPRLRVNNLHPAAHE